MYSQVSGRAAPLPALRQGEEGGPSSLSFSVILMSQSLWNFIMFSGSSEVWQLRTDLAGRRQRPGCDLLPSAGSHAAESQNVSTGSRSPEAQTQSFCIKPLLLFPCPRIPREGDSRNPFHCHIIATIPPCPRSRSQTRPVSPPWN